MATRIQVRRGTTAEWNTSNPVLDTGEFGYNTTNGQLKIGTGSTSWSNLDYLVTDAGLSTSLGDYIELVDKGAANGVAELDASSNVLTSTGIVFEGTANDFETTLVITDPTADRTITLPDSTGTVALTSDLSSFATTSYVTNSVSSHSATTTSVHGISDTTALATTSYVTNSVSSHNATTTNVHGINDTTALATTSYVTNSVSSHAATTATHGVTGAIVGTTDSQTLTGKTISGASNTLTVRLANDISGFGTSVAAALAQNVAATGSVVVFNGALGTPSSGTLTNATGLPVSTGISGLGTGIATFLATPSSANLASAITDETGSGILVFGTSPAITTSITTPSTTFALVNTTATTVNFAGAATTLSMGAGSGTTTINNDLTVSGNLTVNGTTTTVNSTTLTVDDKNIELASITSPTDTTADGAGITVKGATDKTFNWVQSTGAWTPSEHLNLPSGKSYKINNTAISAALPALTWGDVKSGKSGLTIS